MNVTNEHVKTSIRRQKFNTYKRKKTMKWRIWWEEREKDMFNRLVHGVGVILLEEEGVCGDRGDPMPHEWLELPQLKLASITPFGLPASPSDSASASASASSSSSTCFLFPDTFAFACPFDTSIITLQHSFTLPCVHPIKSPFKLLVDVY